VPGYTDMRTLNYLSTEHPGSGELKPGADIDMTGAGRPRDANPVATYIY
jgi:hypothetical protein